ncbi:hypothetical protein FRC09_000978 [Ceratobasidium sp. 395]|nr:hypothetical protein FRC09_000978 [Ceratobasidium sp. 395]
MEIQEDKPQELKLSGFVFADQQPTLGQTNDKQVPVDNTRAGYQAGFDFRRPEAYERMAADKIGQELAQDATIWKFYLEEADEYDQELVKGRHASLDMLLLFAALFSAILTAFLIESKDLLQQDPADVSVALLLAIAQSQYRMEQGASAALNATASAPTIPNFTPSMTARWINGIWFTSLGLSLSAALVAMLGKEWLTAFLASRPRPAHAHALLRQSRLEGLEHWWALHIIALLPSLLHASLLLFAIGLVLYLSTLDLVVAMVIASIIGVTSLFYIVTAILGAIYDFCPFVTELSKYVQGITVLLLRRAGTKSDTPAMHPLSKDIQALLWLANNARDPAVVDCSYQALSGLPPSASGELDPVVISLKTNPIERSQSELPMILGDDITLDALLASTISRFERLIAGSLDMLGSPELSVARYMNAITRILEHTRCSADNFSKSLNSSRNAPSGPAIPANLNGEHLVSSFQLLNTAETLWGNSSMPLGIDTYASVLVSTAKIIRLAVSVELTTESEVQFRDKSNEHTNVDVTLASLTRAGGDSQLADLRAYYSRWLARVTTLLRFHRGGEIKIKSPLLDDLLGAMAMLARCGPLNPVHCISSHHPQPGNTAGRMFSVAVTSNKGITPSLQPNDLLTGPLHSVIDILSIWTEPKDDLPHSTWLAALKAYSVLAPVLLQQILGLPRDELNKTFGCDDWESGLSSDRNRLSFIAVRLALLTTRYLALSFKPESGNHFRFLDTVMLVLFNCLRRNPVPSQFGKDAHSSLLRYGADLVPLLELINESGRQILHGTYIEWVLIEIVSFPCWKAVETGVTKATLCEVIFTPKCLPPLIEMVGHTTNVMENKRRTLQAIVAGVRASPYFRTGTNIGPVEYLHIFTMTARGFSALGSARTHPDCVEIVEEAIMSIIHLAAGQGNLLFLAMELQPLALPPFLDVVFVVAPHLAESKSNPARLMQFARDSLNLMKAAARDSASREIIRQHYACQVLWEAVQTIENKNRTRDLITGFLDAQEELGVRFEEVEPMSDENKQLSVWDPTISQAPDPESKKHGDEAANGQPQGVTNEEKDKDQDKSGDEENDDKVEDDNKS